MSKLVDSAEVGHIKLRPIPKSWQQACGLALKKKKALSEHTKKIRNEWAKK